MSDQPTTTLTASAHAERRPSLAPPLTLLAVIVLWYLGVGALLLSHIV